MSEDLTINLSAFEPNNGGAGARLTAGIVATTALIPGLEGGVQDPKSRVVISNGGNRPAYVRMGVQGVVATLASLEIHPGPGQLLKPPYVGPNAVWISVITASGETTINVCSGKGT